MYKLRLVLTEEGSPRRIENTYDLHYTHGQLVNFSLLQSDIMSLLSEIEKQKVWTCSTCGFATVDPAIKYERGETKADRWLDCGYPPDPLGKPRKPQYHRSDSMKLEWQYCKLCYEPWTVEAEATKCKRSYIHDWGYSQ